MTDAETPTLAVVGHPNKGKSSLVATLAEDASVGISSTPGTTLRSRAYPMRVDGRLLYTLVDTPGFQRARKVLGWLEERAVESEATAADRPRLVAEFLAASGHAGRFPDECELLRPLVDGAGILYVVDGGVPYGPEYEAEMEILRWTGRPSLAVINPIGSREFVADWERALGQFFSVVRVIDALRADFGTRRQLLLAFGELESSWRAPVDLAVTALETVRESQRSAAAQQVAEFLAEALSLVVERRVDREEDAGLLAPELEREYKDRLTRLEAKRREAVQRLYGHRCLEANAGQLEVLESDLFSEGTWLRFGLRRRDLVTVGAVGGATTGGVLDVAVGGASFLLGAAAGAAIGGALGWFGAGRLAVLRVIDRPMGGRLASYGPSRNPNFPFVLLGRARYHCSLLAARTHAMRDVLELDVELEDRVSLSGADRRLLAEAFGKIRKWGADSGRGREATGDLMRITRAILVEDEGRQDKKGHRRGI
jgi:hypothetical protein